MEISKEQVIDYLGSLPVMEMAELVRELEDRWGVSATPTQVPQEIGVTLPEPEAQTEFDVVLTSYGDKKINVIKAVRTLIPGLGLREAKELVEGIPATLKEGITKDEAEQVAKALQEAGGTTEIK